MASVRDYLVSKALAGRLQGDWFPAGTDPWTDPAAQETMLQKALANPGFLAQSNQDLGKWNLNATQLDAAVPDPLKGSLIPSGNDLGGMMLALAPLVAMVGGFAAGAGAGTGAAGATGAAATDTLGSIGAATEAGGSFGGPASWTVNAGGGPAAAGGTNLVYDAASGAFVPEGGAGTVTAGAGGGAGTGGLTIGDLAKLPVGTVAQAVGGSGGGGSGMIYDATTGQVVPGNPISVAGNAASNSAEGGLFGNGSGPFGLTPLQTLGAASTVGSLLQGGAALIGSKAQADAANRATDAQVQMFNTLNAQGQPYREAGYKALGTIMSPENQSYITHQFGPADLQAGLAPGYEFMRDQGLRAVKNAANAQTGLLSGNTLKGVADYATNYALNAGYQPSFNNYESQRTGIFNRLAAIAGLGQTANAQSSSAGSAISPGIAQSTQNAGTALGGGYVGAGNALAGGLTNAASWYALPSILNMGRGP